MLRSILILLILSISACSGKNAESELNNETFSKTGIDSLNDQEIIFQSINGRGILLGDNIMLFDHNLKTEKSIQDLNKQFVDLSEVSKSFHHINSGSDPCEMFKYVNIKANGVQGYVNGKYIYEPVKHLKNKEFSLDGNRFSFVLTRNFGIGIADDDGLTGCSINTPVIFSDRNLKYEGLIKMIPNENYNNNFPYLELKDDDMASDEIISFTKQVNQYLLKINRSFQEGSSNIDIVIRKLNNEYVAEITAVIIIDN